MISDGIALVAFSPDHLEGATRLSQQAGWPHRLEDWQVALALSAGSVAVAGEARVIGTALLTPYGCDAGTINMVIVDEGERGQGLGRRLMQQVLRLAGERRLQLIATADGLPLYEKLGFSAVREIARHQGPVAQVVARSESVRAATPDDIAEITALDAAAFGADRSHLLAHIASIGDFAVLEREDRRVGFAALRRFGRGLVIGPVVASDLEDAKALVAHVLAAREGEFVRLDTGVETGLAPWLSSLGLAHAGGGIVMHRTAITATPRQSPTTFALASQAFG